MDSEEGDQDSTQTADADECVELDGTESATNQDLDERGDANKRRVHSLGPECGPHQALFSDPVESEIDAVWRPIPSPVGGS